LVDRLTVIGCLFIVTVYCVYLASNQCQCMCVCFIVFFACQTSLFLSDDRRPVLFVPELFVTAFGNLFWKKEICLKFMHLSGRQQNSVRVQEQLKCFYCLWRKGYAKKIPHFPTLSPHSVGFLSGSCSQKYEGKCVFFALASSRYVFWEVLQEPPPPPRQVLERYLGKTSKKTEKLSEPYLFRYKKHCGRPKTYWGHNSR